MATLNLGRLKPVFRGAWNNATAYNVDDIVVRSNQSYISIQAGTNQDPATATAYWTLMAAAGTDVGAALANKEIAFKTNAGAVDGIPIGTAGQFLKVNSGATGYEYGSVSSDFVKISTIDVSSPVGELAFNQQFSSTYKKYKLIFNKFRASANNNELYLRLRIGTTNQTQSNEYYSTYHTSYYNGSTGGVNNSNDKYSFCRVLNWGMPHSSGNRSFNGEINFYDPQAYRPVWGGHIHGHERNFDNLLNASFAHTYDMDVNVDGFTLYLSASANFIDGTATLYGIKE
tara:strand:+ start:1151 stop:2008 length:858 start_codon:yes stop_codon:yes gene_type:complete